MLTEILFHKNGAEPLSCRKKREKGEQTRTVDREVTKRDTRIALYVMIRAL